MRYSILTTVLPDTTAQQAAAAHFVRIRSLTVTTMNERSRTSRDTIPGGDGLLGFGAGNVGEAASRIVTIADLP